MHDLLMDIIFELSEAQQALIMFGSMVLMIVLAVPIPIAVAVGTAIGYFMMDLNLVQVALSMYTGVEPFPLVTVPLFVFAGSLMEQGGMARRIVNMAQSMIGNYTGSLGLVAVLGCAFFAALSGSGPATTAAAGPAAWARPAVDALASDATFTGCELSWAAGRFIMRQVSLEDTVSD